MEKKDTNNNAREGSLEWFLRRNFGLKGKYLSDEYEAVQNAGEKAISDWWDDDRNEPRKCYTEEAWDAWERALNMVEDLVTMGLISEDGIDSPAECIRCGFCDNSF